MTNDEQFRRDIFNSAADLEDPSERAAYLDGACDGDPALREEIEELLRHDVPDDDFLRTGGQGSRVMAPIAETLGSVIGPYKLLEQIGEGGFGVVFMAEQGTPVRRKVALKVIKPGMDTRQVIARFEAERQALALMDHPHIARVFDAGATDAGRPYFVMELVRGIPITDYCDEHALTPRERLQLFITVCQAVQHAHQKGVIHRDLKPSNVLVTQEGGEPVVKVIDFGIAKAIDQDLTDLTLFTGYAQFLGTPMYMSPEQASLSSVDVDTRSDIYSLGVLLYELLTGATPFDRERFQGAGLDELFGIIRHEEPLRPSVRLSTLGGTLSTVSEQRHTEPRRLAQVLRGDLDWIAMKALEKDRSRRYESAGDLAADVRRHLDDQPVLASPPSAWYLARKLAQRNKAMFTATALVAAGLVAAVALLAMSNAAIRREQTRTRLEHDRAIRSQQVAEQRAEEMRQGVKDLQAANQLLQQARVLFKEHHWDEVETALTQAIELRPEYAAIWDERGDLYIHLGLFDLAAADKHRAFELQPPVDSWDWLYEACLRRYVGDTAGFRAVSARMPNQFRNVFGNVHALDQLRIAALLPDPDADFPALIDRAERIAVVEPGSCWPHYLLGLGRYRLGQYSEAVEQFRIAESLDPQWLTARVWSPLAMACYQLGRVAEAHAALQKAAATIEAWTAYRFQLADTNWAVTFDAVDDWPVEALDWLTCRFYYEEARLLIDGTPPPADPRLSVLRARSLAGLRRMNEAIAEYENALALQPENVQIRYELHRVRGHHFFRNHDWKRAAEEFGLARQLASQDARLCGLEAISLLASGNGGAYRQRCREILEHFKNTCDLLTANDVVYACVLAPDAVPDAAQLIRLAEVAAGLHPGNERVLGAACYRAGRYADAVRYFEGSALTIDPRAWEMSFLAMAQHRLGRDHEAKQSLDSAKRWMERANREPDSGLLTRLGRWDGLTERFEFPLVYAEAEAVLQDKDSDATPKADAPEE